ncbi:winged helix-turn-helix transcriptional regulator [Arthrobacter sp. BB-1]|uniref:helix-turn-helix transcriptional regulator n=1 Tax=Micrococcaceae TaxID=1268 RepID=UPI001111878D|nr:MULTISPECIES: helix-turn-helix domain-containing protein [Micrococcaceae]TNB69467.1 winged helix-turn-helix transcriptional regulator [Arthrobacter sp. BB-1]UEL28167.1 winged helix-turn-helix transcriptional regulator [Pseudarthrobacter sp. L1SW]
MTRLPWARRLAALASLGDEKRRQLYELVLSAPGAMNRDQAAEATGLPRSTVSFHLDRLVADGLLAVEFHKPAERSGPGSGRPSKLYRAAAREVGASVPDRNYDLAGELMATAIEVAADANQPVRDALLATAYARGKALAQDSGGFEDFLVALGYGPRADGSGGFSLPNCPFHRLSEGHPAVVCAMNGAFLSGAAAGCGEPEERVAANSSPGQCCARITP